MLKSHRSRNVAIILMQEGQRTDVSFEKEMALDMALGQFAV